MRKHAGWWIVKGAGIAVLVAGGLALFGWIVMVLWNAVMPPVFGLKTIDWPLALGLLVLAKIFFGFGGRGHGHRHGPHPFHRGFRGGDWSLKVDKWKHYGDFWKEEGEAAFEAWSKRKAGEAADKADDGDLKA